MRRSAVKPVFLCLILLLVVALYGCGTATPTANPSLTWQVELTKYEVKDKLESIETVKQYVGTTEEVHTQSPEEGNVYLILNLSVSKQGAAATPFEWSQLVIQDSSGNSYPRSSNDTFLEQYNYTPRMTGLELKLGVNEGWLCFEIPEEAANGTLTLVYSGEGSQQEIVVKK